MAAPGIHIDRIELEVRGVSASVAQTALGSLGPALEQALRQHPASVPPPPPPGVQLARVDAGRVSLPPGASADALRTALARELARAVARQLGPTPLR